VRIAVTGGSGRVGCAVSATSLQAGHEVVVLDRREPPDEIAPRVDYRAVDMTDLDAVTSALEGSDRLIHLAGIAGPNEADETVVHANNVVASYNALTAAARLGIRRVVQASSVNAVGATWSQHPHFDYFPIDEQHPTYNEDGYSLSKWIAEQQADSLTRRHTDFSVVSLRFHAFVADRAAALATSERQGEWWAARGLWGYTTVEMIVDACLLACSASLCGHEVFFIVAPTVASDTSSEDLRRRWYPEVPVRGELAGQQGFFDCTRAASLLDWPYGSTRTAPMVSPTQTSDG